MPKITFVQHTGEKHNISVKAGMSVMEAAVSNGIVGIDADCGGACACATCHIFVDADWCERVGGRSGMEAGMLEFADGVRATSRLACQIKISDALDGLVVHLPAAQH